MSIIPQCNEFTTMATIMNGLDTIPSHCDKASVTMTVAMLAKLLDWANSMASQEDIYQVVENMTSANLSGVIDISDWCNIVPNCDNAEEVEEIKPEPEEVITYEPTTFSQEDVAVDTTPVIKDLFDDTEPEAQEALKQFQAKFNIVPEEPTIDNPVIEDNGVSPELENEINEILAIANNIKE